VRDGVDELDCVLDWEELDVRLELVDDTVGVGVADVDDPVFDVESATLAEGVLDEEPFPVPVPVPLPVDPVGAAASTAPTLP
jgi:hypothetical protein